MYFILELFSNLKFILTQSAQNGSILYTFTAKVCKFPPQTKQFCTIYDLDLVKLPGMFRSVACDETKCTKIIY